MKDTIHYIISAIVDNPDAITIEEEENEGVHNFIVTVAIEDMGKVIGKQGRTVRALRSLVYAAGLKQNRRYVLDVVE